jgi:diaminohydroxyphosphoribosylaminopyrimidine deaminase/5-amino-6-(5-phosphoribosylamino)uracil reductase
LVEGGGNLLQSFIESGRWDEVRILTNKELVVNDGLNAPVLTDYILVKEDNIFSDCIQYFRKAQ